MSLSADGPVRGFAILRGATKRYLDCKEIRLCGTGKSSASSRECFVTFCHTVMSHMSWILILVVTQLALPQSPQPFPHIVCI